MRRSLGRGFSQLMAAEPTPENVSEVAVELIDPNARQPRLSFDETALSELAASIKEFGILQPIAVRPIADGRFELIAGERRLRAAKIAGLKSIPVTVRAATDEASLELALIENIQRADINALECARAYRQLADEFKLSQEQIASRVGKSRVAIANTLRLLRLPQPVQQGLEAGQITEGHARALLAFESELQTIAAYRKVLQDGLSVRETEALAKAPQVAKPKSKPAPKAEDPNREALQSALEAYLGAPVKIDRQGNGGALSIQFFSEDDLDRILESLGFRM